MRVVILDSANDVMDCASDFFVEQIRRKADSVLGLATGSTPLALYQKLIEAHKAGLSFEQVTSFNLDEYLGLEASHPQSYHYYMQQALFDHIDICPDSTFVPNGAHDNPKQACLEYEAQISRHRGIDLQLLGIGRNGHIGFNEPSSSLGSRTRVKSLTAETIEDNARFFGEGEFQPRLSLTMGIGTIMDANQVILIATGKAKADAIQATIEGPISAMCPASILQMHQNAVVILDQSAASCLENIDFYSFVESENRKLEASLSQIS